MALVCNGSEKSWTLGPSVTNNNFIYMKLWAD
jgi:hypothetical protein